MMAGMHHLQKIAVAGLCVLGILLGFCLVSLPDGKLHVFVLDVGQGDAILIQTPTAEKILIDGGPDDRVLQEIGKVMPFYEKTIDVVVLSHPHADHVNGLVEVLKRYRVGRVIMSGASYRYPGYGAFLEEIAARGIPVTYAGVSNDYALGAITIDMLFPFESVQGRSFENQNNGSVVLRVLYGRRAFYFSGDLEIEGEEKLAASNLDLRADFFKAGHHGSRTSSSPQVLDRVQPDYAAISCGVDNQFHHPHAITLKHFQERQIAVYRTDLDGIIEAVSDGEQLEVKSWGKSG
jgi:competence protein ComEC